MKHHIHFALSLSALLLPGITARAVDGSIMDTLKLQEVSVTSVTKAPVTLTPLKVTVVNEQEIDKSAESNLLPVLMNRVPGMYVTERGMSGYGVSGGGSGTVNIRGVGQGNKVLFMIDGQPQWAGIFGHALPDTYVTNDVDHVEVVSGPSSLLYGSNAMGGSVNIITRKANTDGFSGSARLAWGSHQSQKYGLKLGYKHGGLNVFAAGSYESSKGHRPGMKYWLANQYAAISYDFSSHWSAGANVTVTEMLPHNPGSLEEPLDDMWTKVTRTTASVYVKNSYGRSWGGLQVYYNWGHHKIDDGHAPDAAPRTYLFHSKDYNTGFTLYQNIRPWQGNILSAGIDFKQWGGHSWNAPKDGSPDQPGVDEHVNEIAGYVMTQQELFNDRLSLNAGVRLEHSSQFGNEWVPQAGFIFRPMTSNHIKFSYSKGFRSPNLRELYMYPPHNPDLKPEWLNNFEVELRQRLLNDKLNIGLSLYYINGRNMIQTVMNQGKPLNVNTGKFINKGVELDGTYIINPKWNVYASYAYLHTDTRIIAAPRNKLFGQVNFTPGRFSFTLESMSVWGVLTEKSKENYSLLDARAAYTLPLSEKAKAEFFLKVDNITNTKYQINYGFPMPGTTFMAGFSVSI